MVHVVPHLSLNSFAEFHNCSVCQDSCCCFWSSRKVHVNCADIALRRGTLGNKIEQASTRLILSAGKHFQAESIIYMHIHAYLINSALKCAKFEPNGLAMLENIICAWQNHLGLRKETKQTTIGAGYVSPYVPMSRHRLDSRPLPLTRWNTRESLTIDAGVSELW